MIGFVAQLVDSSVGMAFGTLSSSLLLAYGFPVSLLSGTVHTAEIFSGAVSTAAHYKLKNIDYDLLKKLAPAAIIGAIIGALLITRVDSSTVKPWVALYFVIIGLVVVIKSLNPDLIKPLNIKTRIIGFIAGFVDAFCGAGWGEAASSSLALKGKDMRMAVGSLNAGEFLVTLAVSIVFSVAGGINQWSSIAALAAGGICAAPLGAWACKKIPSRRLMLAVGVIVSLMGVKVLLKVLL